MKFKESKYCNEKFLGKHLYENIKDNDNELLTAQEFFEINDKEKEYIKKRSSSIDDGFHYKLKVYSNYYELSCYDYDICLFLVFDKPVHVTGQYCFGIIAPEIVIKSSKNKRISYCITNELIINNDCVECYEIYCSKINITHFYNSKVVFWNSEVNNFFIFNKNLEFDTSSFLKHHRIKCFGCCENLKEKISEYTKFKKRIIHIE